MQKLKLRRTVTKVPPALYMLIVLIVLFGAMVDNYFTFKNFSNVLNQSATLLVLACGQTLIVLMQGTDLSLGFMISALSVSWIWLLNLGVPMGAAILLVLVMGCLCGLLNGVLVSKLHLPVFIVTLGTQNIFRSVALLISDSSTIYFRHPIFRTIGKGTFLGLTYTVWIALACFALTWFMLRRTTFGSRVTALGGNQEALTLAGSSVSANTIKAFVYCGLMAAVSGLLLTCRIESGNPLGGNGYEFNSVAAVLLGGTSMREGRGGVGGTILGVLLIQILKAGLNMIGISSIYQNALVGAVVLLAIILDAIVKRSQEQE